MKQGNIIYFILSQYLSISLYTYKENKNGEKEKSR